MDWNASMQQTFEFYKIDPITWRDVELIDDIISCSISRDSTAETLGSATIDKNTALDECYIRVYLVCLQNGIKERIPLGTFLVQTPGTSFDGKSSSISLDAYTPLLELKENPVPLGYYIAKGSNVMEESYKLLRNNSRAPVIKTRSDRTLVYDFVANTNDTWLSFINDLVMNDDYILSLDELGQIMFKPYQSLDTMQPIWRFEDNENSIMYPEISVDRDLYGIPNVVEVICANGDESFYSIARNDNPNSPTSTISRGREITKRVTNPEITGTPTQERLDDYAKRLLQELSTLEYSITYTHGYCPVTIGDCVEINYKRAGLEGIKAKVVSQSIACTPGCPVTEKAVFTDSMWEG